MIEQNLYFLRDLKQVLDKYRVHVNNYTYTDGDLTYAEPYFEGDEVKIKIDEAMYSGVELPPMPPAPPKRKTSDKIIILPPKIIEKKVIVHKNTNPKILTALRNIRDVCKKQDVIAEVKLRAIRGYLVGVLKNIHDPDAPLPEMGDGKRPE